MKLIYINNNSFLKLFYILFLFSFFLLNNTVNCQLSASNGNIIIKDSYLNTYELGPSTPYFQVCLFTSRYFIYNVTSPILSDIVYSSPDMVANPNMFHNSFSYSLKVPATSSANYTVTFTLASSSDPSFSTVFSAKYYCHEMDSSKIQVELISDQFDQSIGNNFWLYFRVKGLNFTLDYLPIFTPFNSDEFSFNSRPINKELYQVTPSIFKYNIFLDRLINVDIIFPGKTFNFTISTLRNSTYQTVDYQNFPKDSATKEFNEYGYGMSSVITFSSNASGFYAPRLDLYYNNSFNTIVSKVRIGQKNVGGLLKFTYISFLYYGEDFFYSYILNYFNGPLRESDKVSILQYNFFPFYDIPLGTFSVIDSLVSFEFSSLSGYKFRNSKYGHFYYSYSLVTQFPYGFIRGNNTVFDYKSNYLGKLTNNPQNKYYLYEYPSYLYTNQYPNPITDTTDDNSFPVINLIEYVPIQGFSYLLRVRAKDQSVVTNFKYYLSSNFKSEIGHESLISYNENDGWLFEIPLNVSSLSVEVSDLYGNTKTFSNGEIVYFNPEDVPYTLSPPEIPFFDLDIENVTLLKNDIDILNKPNYNTIYFNSTTIPKDYPLLFALADDVSINLITSSNLGPYSIGYGLSLHGFLPINYDIDKKLFYCDFIVPKNTNPDSIPYYIHSLHRVTNDIALGSPLRVSRSQLDNEGPIITSIINANTFGKVGWRIKITDQVNGFGKGYIKAVGSLDSSSFIIKFTSLNVSSTGTVRDGEYDIIITDINSNNCATQNYTIEYIYLEDTNKLVSYFDRYDRNYNPIKNPLRNYLDNLEYYLTTLSTCSSTIKDTTPPELVSFSSNKQTIDVGSKDRKLSFKFMAKDLESGLMSSQSPIVYLQEGATLKQIQCESKVTFMNNTHAEYYCEIELPIAFGNPNLGGILVSVYGFFCNAGLFSGFSSDIIAAYTNITVTYTSNSLLTGNQPYYYFSNTDLILFGRWLKNTNQVSITYSDGTTKSYTPSKAIGDSALIVPRNDHPVIGPFKVIATIGSITTNTLIINPIYFNTTEEPEIPIPTNKPQQCLGDPVCGGSSKGICNQDSGCVCLSPWIGKDCSSQVIIVPQPNINDTNPTTEIPIDDGSGVFYSSLISIVSLRELSLNNSIVHEHSLDRWVLNQIDQYTSQYFTNITFKSTTNLDRKFEIYATLKWFINETTIQFAGQDLKMNPSSMKYTIDIFNYPFESGLNRLQLVMHASFLSNKTNDICSSKEFGDTTSGDNSNYIKIQVNNKSLYGRFIKRGVIDDRTVSLSNELLDQEMNAINNPNQVQSYIGISIPWFERQSTIDPDFSVLIDGSSASSTCSSDSGLSNTKIAGIVIGCVAFVTIVAITTIYTIYKKREERKFFESTGNKLKKLNQNKS